MDEDAAAKAPEPSKPARGSWTLDKILKDKRENVKRARLLEELEKKDTDTLQARGGPVEVMMADLQPATDNEDKEIDPLPVSPGIWFTFWLRHC